MVLYYPGVLLQKACLVYAARCLSQQNDIPPGLYARICATSEDLRLLSPKNVRRQAGLDNRYPKVNNGGIGITLPEENHERTRRVRGRQNKAGHNAQAVS